MNADTDTASAGGALLELQQVTKVYGQGPASFQALHGIDLAIQPGRVRGDHGPQRIGQVHGDEHPGLPRRPDRRGRTSSAARTSSRCRAASGRCCGGTISASSSRGSISSPGRRRVENVELPLLYRGESSRARRLGALAALEAVGLTGWETHTPAELSGGQQQRVAIARAIATHPTLLLADEPTGNLDTKRSREIMELLAALNRDQGITVLLVTHESEMAHYAKRVVHFVDGLVDSDRLNGGTH